MMPSQPAVFERDLSHLFWGHTPGCFFVIPARRVMSRWNRNQIFLDCSGNPAAAGATPLWNLRPHPKSGVAAALCHRNPKLSGSAANYPAVLAGTINGVETVGGLAKVSRSGEWFLDCAGRVERRRRFRWRDAFDCLTCSQSGVALRLPPQSKIVAVFAPFNP